MGKISSMVVLIQFALGLYALMSDWLGMREGGLYKVSKLNFNIFQDDTAVFGILLT